MLTMLRAFVFNLRVPGRNGFRYLNGDELTRALAMLYSYWRWRARIEKRKGLRIRGRERKYCAVYHAGKQYYSL